MPLAAFLLVAVALTGSGSRLAVGRILRQLHGTSLQNNSQVESPCALKLLSILCRVSTLEAAGKLLGSHKLCFHPHAWQPSQLNRPHKPTSEANELGEIRAGYPHRPARAVNPSRMQPDEVFYDDMLLPSVAADLPLLRLAARAALDAGKHLVARVGTAEILTTKLDSADLVTAVDKECQDIIKSQVHGLQRGIHKMLGEEDVAPGIDAAIAALESRLTTTDSHAASDGMEGEWLWIVDPIDGTTNFVQGLPLCAVSIGLVDVTKRERMGAVIFDPFREELFAAWRGRGAFLNGQPVTCSGVSKLSDAVLCGCSPKLHAVETALRGIAALMPRARSLRILGSGVLNFAWVACGRLSAYWEPELAPWDTAAGTLLIEEAGGNVSDLDGSAFKLESRAVLGSASGIHRELLQALQEADATHVRSG